MDSLANEGEVDVLAENRRGFPSLIQILKNHLLGLLGTECICRFGSFGRLLARIQSAARTARNHVAAIADGLDFRCRDAACDERETYKSNLTTNSVYHYPSLWFSMSDDKDIARSNIRRILSGFYVQRESVVASIPTRPNALSLISIS